MASRPPYSTRFLRGALSSGTTSANYLVPVGYVAVVKDIVVLSAIGTSDVGSWGDPGAAFYGKWSLTTANPQWHWNGSQVFNAGDTIGVQWNAGSFWYGVSGYLLSIA